ncbi:MAG: DNA cytosine methyltransferase [Candidatus Paceibacterota bacterium]
MKQDNSKIKFIDLFAGIGGFNIAFSNAGAECVFVSELDQKARETYQLNFKKKEPWIFEGNNFVGDIKEVDPKNIPDFNILTGGFPCQPFSHAGKKKGFDDVRGTLFYDIVKILKEKRPEAFFLENVSHFLKHDNGNTFAEVKRVIEEELGYSFYYKIVRASDFNLPQHRARLFMIGFKNKEIKFEFPKPIERTMTMSNIFGAYCEKDIGYTLRVGGRGSGLHDRRNWDTYLVDGKAKRITVEEGKRMMGFPETYQFPVSEAQAMKQLGNSVAVPAIQAVAKQIIKSMKEYDKSK